ncbi:MAG: BrnA antitoxin family protein [Caulobacteraceae bacterium]|nr:BrnA antitoxin family protein [Caulobacteraceae bacterium]
MKAKPSNHSPERLRDELAALESMADADIDTSDIPEVVDWSGGVRGRFYRPVKQLLSVRLDADVVAWFKAAGEGYQTRINAALREHVKRHTARR